MMGSFPECDVKLCDFEISRVVLEGTEVREILGTPDYVAPEILHYEPITLAADMWSLGVTTYVLLTGFSPFGGETDQETFQNISLGEVDFPEELFEDISAQAKDFVARLLVLDPSARMSAKQCLRHEWLRGAPTQASPHLRKYLSKSREVLLERVVSRENLRRAILLSQATSHANLSEPSVDPRFASHLSQSEMCLNLSRTSSRGSLISSECYMSPADSQTSLASSQNSLAVSQSYLLNKEQTQGLLNQAQSRSQANLNNVARRGLLSRMRSLNQIQSQACLLNSGKTALQKEYNPLFGSRSQEKLYGLKCLSKSQGVLDIYRSLECLRNSRKIKMKNQRSVTEYLPFTNKLRSDTISTSTGAIDDCGNSEKIPDAPQSKQQLPIISHNDQHSKKSESPECENDEMSKEPNEKIIQVTLKDLTSEAEENLDSLQSVESDTLTEDSDETPIDKTRLSVKQPSQRQHSNISSHSNNSVNSDEKEEQSDFETDEPKYSVAQLVSAFNKHQEVASKTSLEAIMTEKRVNEVTFPTGPKALRLFIPDINITERGMVVRRKTSYKPRKNWEELRKQNEKNEGLIKDFDNDSGNEDNEESGSNDKRPADKSPSTVSTVALTQVKDEELHWTSADFSTIDDKYKHCVNVAKSGQITRDSYKPDDKSIEKTSKPATISRFPKSTHQKERLPNYIYPEMMAIRSEEVEGKSFEFPRLQKDDDSSVNLKDILQKSDSSQMVQKDNLEKLRKRTSITKIIVNDNLLGDSDTNNNGLNRAKSEPPVVIVTQCQEEQREEGVRLSPSLTRSSSSSSESTSPTPPGVQSAGLSWDKEGRKPERKTSTTCESSKLLSEKLEMRKMTPEERRMRGKVCTGSYTRAMEKFTKTSERKSINSMNTQNEKIRRKSTPNMPPNGS
uniref:CG32666_0 protein n=3 Tax=Fopius arisanus TaxID=64838 RepID=A0A0C9R1E7_9HYME